MLREARRKRQFPIGAEYCEGEGVHFRVWAPHCAEVELVIESDRQPASHPLAPETDGYFSLWVPDLPAGTRYRYRLERRKHLCADPASRFQPEGPHGPSMVVDGQSFSWTDRQWPGLRASGQVLYELHVGTFTSEGTWQAAARELPALAELGITCVELMPIADFVGEFGWSYDGVCLYAPTRLYGAPDDLRQFVNRAHELGLGVILDVVYNHFGAHGNCLPQYAPQYFSDKHTEWGQALNFDGPLSQGVREFFITNARYWVEEFHLDGFRIDAVQAFHDDSAEHVLTAIVREARAAARPRELFIVGENEPQDSRPLGEFDFDAVWNDDFHHSATVALTGHNEAYYTDYLGEPEEFIATAKWGYLYQGQRYRWQKKRRGAPCLDQPATGFVNYLQNHDQLANSARGARMHELTSPGRYRAMTALWLLSPQTPMFFQGQEFASTSPFLFFADSQNELAEQVRAGRLKFLAQFPSLALPEVQAQVADPDDRRTFERCKLDHQEREQHARAYHLHRDLLGLRRDDAVFSAQNNKALEGARLRNQAFVLRYFGDDGDDRLLIVNLGKDVHLDPCPQPLLAPPAGRRWVLAWSSEDTRYGGTGTPAVESEENWRIPGEAAVVMRPGPEICND